MPLKYGSKETYVTLNKSLRENPVIKQDYKSKYLITGDWNHSTAHKTPSENGPVLKGKNLLLLGARGIQFFPFRQLVSRHTTIQR